MAAQSTTLPALGQIVGGKYVLKELIGQGGMGSVFAAEHTSTGKEFALKIMLADPTNKEAMDRFKREARAAGKLVSENIVDVIDVAEENGYAFMVLELLRGEDLGKVLDAQRGPLPVSQAIGYVLQALDGIGAAHAAGIVHRDLKPSNLFRARRSNGAEVIKVLDFGISKVSKQTHEEKPEQLTSTKAMLGSPLYMSPEQLRSSKAVDHRADIWAVGVILYELLTNSLPFHGETLGELFAAILEAAPTPPAARNPSLPPGLDAVILRCLRLRVDERFGSCEELKRALAPFASAQGHTMLASTAFMPNAPNGFPHAARVTGPAAMTPPGGGPMMQPRPQPPAGSAATGSGVHPPVVKPMGPMGSTPQPGWGNTTGGNVPKSNGPMLAIAVLGAFLILGGVGTVLAIYSSRHKGSSTASSSAPSEAPPEPPPPVSVVTAPPPPATNTTPDTSASTSASVASNAKPPQQGHGPKTPPVKDPPKTQEPPKVVDAPPPPKPPAPTPKPPASNGTLMENSR